MRKLHAILLASILFLGCKAPVEIGFNYSDLINVNPRTLLGDLYVEIPSCNDYSDSRLPSTSVIEAQRDIPYIFNGAEYVECFSKDFTSLVHFKIPVAVVKENDDKIASGSMVYLISNDNVILSLGIPKKIKENLEIIENRSFGMGSIEDISFTMEITNDTDESISCKALSCYIDEQPVLWNEMESSQGAIVNIKLSNASVDYAFKYGVASILFR